MPTPISAELFVPVFTPTGNPGEYSFDSAAFNNQADVTGNGAADVTVGMALYVQASSLATAMPITGVQHRYRFTQVIVVDAATLSGVVVWDEPGPEEDQPSNGCYCLLAQVTPKLKLGLVPVDTSYPSITPGSSMSAVLNDVRNIEDNISGGAGAGVKHYDFPVSLRWVVNHGMGTKSFVASYRDAAGQRFYAGEEIIDNNSFAVNLTEAMSGSVDVVF